MEILGEDDLLDMIMDGFLYSLMLGWMKNIICLVIKGCCEFFSFLLLSMYGLWCG